MTDYETYRQKFIKKSDQDDEGIVRSRFDAMEFAFDFGYTEGKEAAVKKIVNAMVEIAEEFEECADYERKQIGRDWHIRAKWLQKNKDKIIGAP